MTKMSSTYKSFETKSCQAYKKALKSVEDKLLSNKDKPVELTEEEEAALDHAAKAKKKRKVILTKFWSIFVGDIQGVVFFTSYCKWVIFT